MFGGWQGGGILVNKELVYIKLWENCMQEFYGLCKRCAVAGGNEEMKILIAIRVNGDFNQI